MPQSSRPLVRPGALPYGELPPSGEGYTDLTPGRVSIANSPAVPVRPRGGMTAERRLKMLGRRAWTNGDMGAVERLATGEVARDFSRERDATNFGQSVQLQGMLQQSLDARRRQESLDRFEMWKQQQQFQQPSVPTVPETEPADSPTAGFEMWRAGQGVAPEPSAPVPVRPGGGAIPWVPGAPAPYLPKPGEPIPTRPTFGVQQAGDWDILYQNTPEGQKFINARGAPKEPPGIELTQVPGVNRFVPTLGKQRVAGVPDFEKKPVENLQPDQAGPRRPGEYLSPVEVTKPKVIKVYDPANGRIVDLPEGYAVPAGWQELKMADGPPGAAVPPPMPGSTETPTRPTWKGLMPQGF